MSKAETPLSSFVNEIYTAMDLPSAEWRATIERLLQRLASIWAMAPSAECAYAIGYCHFHMPGYEAGDFEEARSRLSDALELAPEHVFASYYLGCLHFEYKRYEESDRYLRQVPNGWFESRDLMWREHKRREILLCVRIATNGVDVLEKEITNVMRIHHDDPCDEVWPLPLELVATLVGVKANDRRTFDRLAPVLLRELMDCGLEEEFAAELDVVK